jgi:DNA-binding transcriptional ArsR family regulator
MQAAFDPDDLCRCKRRLILRPFYIGPNFQTSPVSRGLQSEGRFAMSKTTFQLLRLVDRIDAAHLSAGAAALLSFLLRSQRDGKWYIATGEALASALKKSRRSIVRHLQELRAAGLLAVWVRKAVVDGVRRNIASGYRVLVDAVRDVSGVGSDLRAARIKAHLRASLERVKARLSARSSCAKSAQRTPEEHIKGLWNMLGQLPEASAAFADVVSALIRAGQGENPAQFAGCGAR